MTALLDTEDAKTAVARKERHDLTSMPVLLSFFAVGCVVHCSPMNMAPSATLTLSTSEQAAGEFVIIQKHMEAVYKKIDLFDAPILVYREPANSQG